jgi:hypothetical protein
VVEKTGASLTREGFLSTVDRVGSFDLGGFVLKFSSSNHQGSDQVYLTVIKGGQVTPLQ